MNSFLQNAFYKSSILFKNLKCSLSGRFYSDSILNVDTNVTRDVVLYSFKNERQVQLFNIFGLAQLFFWNYWGYLMYTTLKDTPIDESKVDENTSWYNKINLGQNKYRYGLTAACIAFGNGIFLGVLIYTSRSVKSVVLNRGGKAVTLSVFTPWGGARSFNKHLSQISCVMPRDVSRYTIPLKVKGRSLFYTLDVRGGNFRNTVLFDATVGLKRNLA